MLRQKITLQFVRIKGGLEMKKTYEIPMIEVVMFQVKDVITASFPLDEDELPVTPANF